MLYLCGNNDDSQLIEKSNNESVDDDKYPIISPFVKLNSKASLISSFSVYSRYSAFITKDGEAFTAGKSSNNYKLTKFKIEDGNGTSYFPISTVCCLNSTLHMVSPSKTSSKRLLAYTGFNLGQPSDILNTGASNPVAIYGGDCTAASINSDGSITFIPYRNRRSMLLEQSHLPDNDEAICVACCKEVIYVAGSSGNVFKSKIPKKGNKLNFTLVESLEGKKITEVSGTNLHCFAVSDDGRVFGCGSNYNGKLGIGETPTKVDDFVPISLLIKYKIIHAYAGQSHSLFQTDEGKVLACGPNKHGQLFSKKPSTEIVYYPTETEITKNATFCIAGYLVSAVFIGCDPVNSPNRPVLKQETKENTTDYKVKKSNTETNFFVDSEEESEFHTEPIKIGEGATSITYKIFDKRTKTPICKKVLKYKEGQTTIIDAQNALKEFEVLYRISHPCICKAVGINTAEKIEVTDKNGHVQNMTTIALFLEFLDYNLSELLKMKIITNTTKVRIVLDVAHAMNFVHKRGMMHRDLKIENIMLNSFFETKLVDFGLVKINESVFDDFSYVEESLTKGVGTFAYMSPEMANEEEYNNKTDVYSFGVLLHAIFTGSLPKQNLRDKVTGKNVKLPDPSDLISDFCINLIKKCMSFKSSDRPSFDEILSQIRENSYELAAGVDYSILSKRDKELESFEKS